MNKKDFIALGEMVKKAERGELAVDKSDAIKLRVTPFTGPQIEAIAAICGMSASFEVTEWIEFVRGIDYGNYTRVRRRRIR